MHCPVCGQQQVSENTRFCSRCGFLLTGVSEIVASGGVMPGSMQKRSGPSPRKRGLKQGLFIFLLSFLIVPLISIITVAVNGEPFAVAMAAILLIMGGLLRIVYALMFESNEAGDPTLEEKLMAKSLKKTPGPAALPAQQTPPASDYVSPGSGWRDTNELGIPLSVTDNTTKLLEKEDER